MILALDTTSEFGSIALVDRNGAADEIPLHSPDGFAHVIYDEISRLLTSRAIHLRQIAAFAAASGPGSFTGVRIGLTVAKGLAEMTGKRVAAVSNLQALAWFGTAPLRATLIDAHRGEIYGAVYDSSLALHAPEVVMKYEEWLKTLPDQNVELISANPLPFQPPMPIIKAPRALAAAIGTIAWRRLHSNQTSDPAEVDANYVRRSDAELFWRGS